MWKAEDFSREVHLRNDALILDDAICCLRERIGKERPRHERAHVEDRIRQAARRHARKASEKDTKDEHGKDGLQDRPCGADGRLLVANFEIAPDEKIEQLAVAPELSPIELRDT